MSTPTNVKPIGAYNNCFRVSVLAENLTTGVTELFSIVAGIPDKSLSLNLMNINSMDKNTNTVYVCNGEFGADTSAEAIVETMDFSIALNQDYNTIVNEIAPETCKDIWRALLTGDKFVNDGVEYLVLGVNGQKWKGTTSAEILDTKYLLYRDSLLKHPARKDADGNPYMLQNGKANPFLDRPLHMFEIMGEFSPTEKSGYRIAYALNTGATFNEDTTANNHSIDEKRLCDVFDISEYLVDGVSNAEELAISGDDSIYRVEVDYIVEVSEGGVPTVGGTSGDTAAVIDTADGTVELYKYSTTWSADPVTSTLGLGAKIFSEKYDTSLALTTPTSKNVLVSIKTLGTTGIAEAVNWKTDSTGSGDATYVLGIKDWSYVDQEFVTYEGE